MEIRLSFDNRDGVNRWNIDLGDLQRFEEELRLGVSATEAVQQITNGA
jgi:site-specific DNA recombinase